MSEEAFAEKCPVCRGYCNCKSCLRLDIPLKELEELQEQNKFEINDDDKVQHSKYILQMLIPFLRQFNQEQMMEKDLEAKIQGLSLSDVKLQKAECSLIERVYCNNCKTSIVDFHRSCPSCYYDLCLTCCCEFRVGNLQGGEEEVVMPYVDNGSGYLHGEVGKPGDPVSLRSRRSFDIPVEKSKSEWKVNENGSIPCPPESLGGCGCVILVLKHLLAEDWVSELLVKTEDIARRLGLRDITGCPTQRCSCFNSMGEIEIGSGKLLKAASQVDSDENYLYCPAAKDLERGDLKHFQWHWFKGQPVIVSNELETSSGLSWEPMVMWRAFRQVKNVKHSLHLDVTAVNCLDWCEFSLASHLCSIPLRKLTSSIEDIKFKMQLVAFRALLGSFPVPTITL